MRIIWAHDFTTSDYLGGAELTDQYWIDKARELDIQVMELNYKYSFYGGEVDHVVISNYSRLKKTLLRDLTTNPYTVIVHGNLLKHTQDFYNKAEQVICMSPDHAKRIQKVLPKANVTYSPPFVDTSIFRVTPESTDRLLDSYLYIGGIYPHKGISDIIKYSRKNKVSVDFFGPTDGSSQDLVEAIKLSKNRFHGPLNKHEDVSKYMNIYQNFVWFLNRKGSYGRTLVEALLCGMNLIVNKENFELFSYDWDFNNPNDIKERLNWFYDNFWRNIL